MVLFSVSNGSACMVRKRTRDHTAFYWGDESSTHTHLRLHNTRVQCYTPVNFQPPKHATELDAWRVKAACAPQVRDTRRHEQTLHLSKKDGRTLATQISIVCRNYSRGHTMKPKRHDRKHGPAVDRGASLDLNAIVVPRCRLLSSTYSGRQDS